MNLNFKKRILIIEDTKAINKAIRLVRDKNIIIDKSPILKDNWINDLKKDNIINHPLIKKYNIDINSENILLKSFYGLYTNVYDGLIVGHIYSSKIVFIYSIIFFGNDFLSTCFITKQNKKITVWSDCALNINPNYDLLKKIIINATNFYFNNVKKKKNINVHLLSFSTFEESNDESIKKYKMLINDSFTKGLKYNINIIGPIQYDASINKSIFYKKTNNMVYYKPDVFIFPDLNSGNIAYKIQSQYFEFYGPFICGTNKKVADLSRSATYKEILETILYLAKY